MKDLTHYFNSSKEEENISTDVVTQSAEEGNSSESLGEAKLSVKKRKISLSKTKSKNSKNNHSTRENAPDVNIDGNDEETKTENVAGDIKDRPAGHRKKRKSKQENNTQFLTKKVKLTKSLRVTEKKNNSTSPCKMLETVEKESVVSQNYHDEIVKSLKLSKDVVVIEIDSTKKNEELLKIKKTYIQKNLFLDSDIDTPSKENSSTIINHSQTEDIQNSDKSPNSSRKNLFSYFNKVDKESVLKPKPEKIKVEALIHLPPAENKVSRRSLSNVPMAKKSKKYKVQLDNSDTIEIISSEEIVDENDSVDTSTQKASVETMSLKTTSNYESTETINKEVKEIVNSSGVRLNNLASIFITRKIEKHTPVYDGSHKSVNKTSLITEEKENIILEKQSNSSKIKRKSDKCKSLSKNNEKPNNVRNKKMNDNEKEMNNISYTDLDLKKNGQIYNKSKSKFPFAKTSKIPVNKIELENNTIENVDDNEPVSVNIQEVTVVDTLSLKTCSNTGSTKEIKREKETINTSGTNLNNLASIFITKKNDKQNTLLSDYSLTTENKTSPITEEKENRSEEKKAKSSKMKGRSDKFKSSSKNSVKPNYISNKKVNKNNKKDVKSTLCSDSDSDVTMSGEIHSKMEQVSKNKSIYPKAFNSLNGFVKTLTVNEDHVSSPANSKSATNKKVQSISADEHSLENIQKAQNSDTKSPIKADVHSCVTSEDNKAIKTPKNKSATLNGYFTPNNKIDEKMSERKSGKRTPRWVMKVRFNRGTKPADSEEDNVSIKEGQEEDSGLQQTFKEETEEIVKCSQDEDSEEDTISVKEDQEEDCGLQPCFEDETEETVKSSDDEVVIVDDNKKICSEKSETSLQRRKSLPRCAKKLNLSKTNTAEETKPVTPKPPVKVWPFFQKGGSRKPKDPPVDEAKLKAKMLFLESGIPEVIKRKVDTVKNEAVVGSIAPFPTVSHVTQTDGASQVFQGNACLPPPRCSSPTLSPPPWSSILALGNSVDPEIPVFQRPKNVKILLEQLKEEEPNIDVKSMYKRLKECKANAETDVWTDVYRPTKSAHVLGNSESIKKLKTWLETLKNRRKREGSDSSGDEFVNEDSEGENNTFSNTAIISGPCGCGKTSAIYAIANELDCKVLEINASCNRSGKRILAEFSESTQSHQVERTQFLNGLLNSQGTGRSKKKKKFKPANESKSEKTSLILVEDADLLFTDFDEGFMPALVSLAATAKRPLILVTNEARNPHLDRFNNKRLLQLTLSRPKAAKLALWLRLVGLVEGVVMSAQDATSLAQWANCDIRRSLLQLQLLVHSNNSELKERLTESELWWRWPASHQLRFELPTLVESEDVEDLPSVDKQVVVRQLQATAQTTSQLAYLDLLSASCHLDEDRDGDPCPVAWRASCQDSTSLTERKEGLHTTGHHSTTQDLAEWLIQHVIKDLPTSGGSDRFRQTPQEARWLSILRQGEQLFMSGVMTTAHTNHQSVTCDYLPTLRELERADQIKLANYTRRANRFFSYLQGLGIHASKSYRDFMSDAFS